MCAQQCNHEVSCMRIVQMCMNACKADVLGPAERWRALLVKKKEKDKKKIALGLNFFHSCATLDVCRMMLGEIMMFDQSNVL